MDRLKKTKQTLIFIAIISIASMVSYVVFFKKVEKKNEAVFFVTKEADAAVQKEIKLRSVKELIKDTEMDRSKLDTYFVSDDKIVDFIEDVENLGLLTDSYVEVISVNVSSDRGSKDSLSELLNIDFEVKGGWREIFHFVTLLEKMPFKIDVSRVNLEVVYDNTTKKDITGVWKGFFSIAVIKSK